LLAANVNTLTLAPDWTE